MPAESDFLLVIPAYGEQGRLPPFLRGLIEALADRPFGTTVQIVEDGPSIGSGNSLRHALASIAGKGAITLSPLLCHATRMGKGCAIRTGWAVPSTARWLAFVDADGAISPAEVRRVFTLIHENGGDGVACWMAIRTNRNGRLLRRRWLRNAASRFFISAINALFQTHFSDTQCGFKILSRSAWNEISSRCVENGFCFDVELLVRLTQARAAIREVEIDWVEKSGGHFRLVPDGLRVLWRAVKLRFVMRADEPGRE